MWLDELYDRTVLSFSRTSAVFCDWMDRYIWDGFVRAFASLGRLFASFTTAADERAINPGVDETTAAARALGRFGAVFHAGQIQRYLAAVAISALVLLILYAWLA